MGAKSHFRGSGITKHSVHVMPSHPPVIASLPNARSDVKAQKCGVA